MAGKIVTHRTCACTHKSHFGTCGSRVAEGQAYCEWCRKHHRW